MFLQVLVEEPTLCIYRSYDFDLLCVFMFSCPSLAKSSFFSRHAERFAFFVYVATLTEVECVAFTFKKCSFRQDSPGKTNETESI